MKDLELQVLLLELGFNPGPLDGRFGSKTERAVRQFQAVNGLRVDGIVGPKTRAALEARGAVFSKLSVDTEGVDLIKAWEGVHDGDKKTVVLEPEMDPIGIWTIGFGHALTDSQGRFIRGAARKKDADAWMIKMYGKPHFTRDEAKALLSQDLNRFLKQIEPAFAGRRPTQGELNALVSLSYNIGATNFRSSTVLKRFKASVAVSSVIDLNEAKRRSKASNTSGNTEFAFGAWSRSGAKKVWTLGLFRRRMCEAMIYRGDRLEPSLKTAFAIN